MINQPSSYLRSRRGAHLLDDGAQGQEVKGQAQDEGHDVHALQEVGDDARINRNYTRCIPQVLSFVYALHTELHLKHWTQRKVWTPHVWVILSWFLSRK